MELSELNWQGPPVDDGALLTRVPDAYAALLREINGWIQFDGGLHVRGICQAPNWHSLQHVWTGPLALHRLYTCLTADDVPFAEEATGDQFILRDGAVHRLSGGTDELEPLSSSIPEFMESAQADPVRFLELQPLVQFLREGKTLEPGQSISVYPPFIFEESGAGVSLEALPSLVLVQANADLARQMAGLPVGTRVKVQLPSSRGRWWHRWRRPPPRGG